MPIATAGQPVELLCPWCQHKATNAQARNLAARIDLTKLGRDNMVTVACPSCGKSVGLFVGQVYFRLVQVS
jgi:predicted RNA-binding Zn-ribbon protein involved in translation (DUF1610 family)